mmetsp:Transcript_828/g.2286  ORF Transcript_828/g.2286 Transcript_828/m.2286 type:complete len:250 (-) Transcript_828:20-769(-)
MAAFAREDSELWACCSSHSSWNCCLVHVTVTVSQFGFRTSKRRRSPSPLARHVNVQSSPPNSQDCWDSLYQALASTGASLSVLRIAAAPASSPSSSPNSSRLLSSSPALQACGAEASTLSGHSWRPSWKSCRIAAVARPGPDCFAFSSQRSWNCCLVQVTINVSRLFFRISNLSRSLSAHSKQVSVHSSLSNSHDCWDSMYQVSASRTSPACFGGAATPACEAPVGTASSSPNVSRAESSSIYAAPWVL